MGCGATTQAAPSEPRRQERPLGAAVVSSDSSAQLQLSNHHFEERLPTDAKVLYTIGGGRATAGDKTFIKWVTESRHALQVYQRAATSICIRAELMAESRTGLAVEFLTSTSKDAHVSTSIDVVALAAVKKAWPDLANDDGKARSATREVPGLANGCPFQGAKGTHDSLEKWQQNLLRLSLSHLTSQGSPDELQISFGMLMRGARECQSRKTWAFYSILTRCLPGSMNSADPGDPLSCSRQRILAAVREFLDDEKDAAFQTHFVEPSWMYLAATRNGNPDVVVHGANTYLAVLAAALGIRLCREPYLADESKGVVPFLDYEFENGALEALQSDTNFGRSWEAVGTCKNPKLKGGAPNTANLWLQHGGSPRSNAADALNKPAIGQKARPYLEAFAGVFRASRLLPRLFSRLTQSDALTAALNEELCAFHREALRADGADDGTEEDCRFFLWDLEAKPEPAFNVSRALILFSRVGIVKAAMAPAALQSPAPGAEHQNQPAFSSKDRSSSDKLVREVSGKLLSEEERETPLMEG